MAETLGSLVDKLSVVNLKIWHQEELAQEPGASDHQVAEAKRKISAANLQRNALIQEIDEFFSLWVMGAPITQHLKDYSRHK